MALLGLLRHRLARLLTVALAALFVASLAPAPAHAAYSSPVTVNIQLRSYDAYYNTYLVGKVYGTIQFDSSNSRYRLSLVVCRQSSYVAPNVTVSVNGAYHHSGVNWDQVRRPDICDDIWGNSGTINGDFTYNGVVRSVTISIRGIHYDWGTAKEVQRQGTYDNPFN